MNNEKEFVLSSVFCLHNGVVVLDQDEKCITFGLLNEEDELLKKRLEHAVLAKLNFSDSENSTVFISVNRDEFNKQISSMFSHDNKTDDKNLDDKKNNELSENEAAALLDALIGNAIKECATDIHIEGNVVRYRVGGKLIREIELSNARRFALIQRVKLLSGLNVLEHRKPQDGNFVYKALKNNIFVRVSTLPTVGSFENEFESIVLRLLDPNRIPLVIEKLGFDEKQILQIKEFCNLENGLVLICGATGSGKSTTAGAMLEEIKNSCGGTKKIISLEDPPEYILDGVNQVQIQDCHGMGFSEVLRRVLRQDPDVIFVGEIRDRETAEIAVQAALTGHLVFATLHTGTISQGVLRMYDLGVSPKLVNAVLSGIIVQHIVDGKMFARIQSLNPADVIENKMVNVE